MSVGRPRGQPSAQRRVNDKAMPVLKDLFALQDKARMTDAAMAEHAGYNSGDIASWRGAKRRPLLLTLSNYAEVFGYEIRLVPKV